jgi:hypothetical protein
MHWNQNIKTCDGARMWDLTLLLFSTSFCQNVHILIMYKGNALQQKAF